IEVTDATGYCLGGFRAKLARWAGAERRAHEIIAKPCHGGGFQTVCRPFLVGLQDPSSGVWPPGVLSATKCMTGLIRCSSKTGSSFDQVVHADKASHSRNGEVSATP